MVIYLYSDNNNEVIILKLFIMNTTLNILNNSFEYFENDMVIVNLKTEEIIWKNNCFNPKYRNDILFLLKERKNNVG